MSTTPGVKIVGPLDGKCVSAVGDLYRYLAAGEDTGGRYAFMHGTVSPGGGPPPHIHTREVEAFYVLKGEITFLAGEKTVVAGAGTFVHVQIGTVHAFENAGATTAEMLILVAPSGLEKMFDETGTVVNDPKSAPLPVTPAEIEKLIEVAPRYGIELKLPH